MWSLDVEEVLVGAGLLLDLRTPLVVIEADTRAPAVDIAVVRTVAANTAVAGTAVASTAAVDTVAAHIAVVDIAAAGIAAGQVHLEGTAVACPPGIHCRSNRGYTRAMRCCSALAAWVSEIGSCIPVVPQAEGTDHCQVGSSQSHASSRGPDTRRNLEVLEASHCWC